MSAHKHAVMALHESVDVSTESHGWSVGLGLTARCVTLMPHRSTLLQVQGSLLQQMFSPERQHLLPRNSRRQVFLDFDPQAFAQILTWLRELKMSGGAAGPRSPESLSAVERPHLLLLLEHLGLTAALLGSRQSQEAQPAVLSSDLTRSEGAHHAGHSGLRRQLSLTEASSSSPCAPASHSRVQPQQRKDLGAHVMSFSSRLTSAIVPLSLEPTSAASSGTAASSNPSGDCGSSGSGSGLSISSLGGRLSRTKDSASVAATASSVLAPADAAREAQLRSALPAAHQHVSSSQLYYIKVS